MHTMQPSHRLRFTAMLLCTTLLVVSCSDDDGPAGPSAPGAAPAINSFSATPSSVAAAGDSVELRWRTTGASSVAIEPGIGAVTPPDSGSVRTFVAATTTFTLTATNAAGSVTQDAVVTAASVVTITVTGTVVSLYSEPLPNTPVIISGLPPTTTDASGTFTISGVSTPYDATVVAAADKRTIIYKGLTRPDPTLTSVDLTSILPPYSAVVTGTVSGGTGFPQPANHTTRVAFVSEQGSGGDIASGTTGAYNLTGRWGEQTTVAGTIHALQWEVSSNLPVTYKGYGSKDAVTLADGGSFPGQNVTLTSVPTVTLTGNVTVSSGYMLMGKVVAIVWGRFGGISVVSDLASTGAFTYATPDISGTTVLFRAIATSAMGNSTIWRVGLAPDASGVNVTIPAAPSLSLPVNAATNVDTLTVFSWTAFAQGVHLAFFDGPAGEPDYYVLTQSASSTIPNLNAIGLGLPSSTAYQWSVSGIAPLVSVDEAAGPGGFYPIQTENPSRDGSLAVSTSRSFTTKP